MRAFKNCLKVCLGALALMAVAFPFAACGKGNSTVDDLGVSKEGTTIIYYNAAECDASGREAHEKMVNTYNSTQGEIDKVYVQAQYNPAEINVDDSQLGSKYRYDVVGIRDGSKSGLGQFKALGYSDYFVNLDEYLTDEVKISMNYDDIPDLLLDRFRMNTVKNSSYNKYDAGEGATLQAMPIGSTVHVLYYNKSLLKNAEINLISVEEGALLTAENGKYANVKPHGYAEYSFSPYTGAVSSLNERGETVYKVFNDRIAMNWEELRCVSRMFQKRYGCEYGYMSEWWFNYGWSVGGDCIGWNETAGKYEFTICDKQSNYLTLDNVTVRGKSYAKGEILCYEDKTYLNDNPSVLSGLSDKLYVMPSMYEAFLEFNRLGVPSDKEVDDGNYGYGIAPSTTTNRAARFTSGKSPFLVEEYEKINSYSTALKGEAEMAPNVQYREYVGGSTYQKDGTSGFANEYLKVIGKEYDGEVYTGDVKTINGVKIQGRQTAASQAYGLAIPKNTTKQQYAAAFKFVSWAAGPNGQLILSESNKIVPNQVSLGYSDEFLQSESKKCNNRWAAVYVAERGDIGDYSYFETRTWIDAWSQQLNGDVRNGNMTLTNFIKAKKSDADKALGIMNCRMIGR